MQFEKAYSFLIEKLKNELSTRLSYHNVDHTRDVIQAAEYLAKVQNVSDYDLTILRTAALFHDSGFLETYTDHEKFSCKNAIDFLPQFEYTKDDIEKVCELISATKMPQSPKNKLAEILCDADLFYLGTTSFQKKGENLYKEMRRLKLIGNKKEWLNYQIEFLESHNYFTRAATEKLKDKKEENLYLLTHKPVLYKRKKSTKYNKP